MERILEGRSWIFDKYVLLLQDIHSMEQPGRVTLDRATFWLRLYDLSAGAKKEGIISKIASKAGRVISIGYQKDNYLGGRCVRVRVEINDRQPFVRGTQLQIRGGEPMFITFKYERLQHFCYNCGRLGHTDRDCEGPTNPDQTNQYMDPLRALPESARG